MRILVTGAAGFLGWHLRVRLAATTEHEVDAVDRDEWPELAERVANADAVIHLAGVNRGPEDEVRDGNIRLAQELAETLSGAGRTRALVYANSIQAGNRTPYGDGKEQAGTILRAAAAAAGVTYTEVLLPNIFGEHGQPDYNSFVATFVHRVAGGLAPQVTDRDVELLHVQDAAATLLDALVNPSDVLRPRGTGTTVAGVLDLLVAQHAVYRRAEIPVLRSLFELQLFNTLRAAMFPASSPMPLEWRTDERGGLVEVVRAQGSAGQTFLSHTHPGVTRGQHFHLRKLERFAVLGGEGRIALRRALTDEVVTFDVSGDRPVVVDMPTLWAHSLTNTGSGQLTTVFWTSELFDPGDPDTYPMVV